MRRVVVVGASLAGVHAIQALRDRGYDGEIVLVGAERDLPYDRPPLSKAALLGTTSFADLTLRPPEWYEQQAVRLALGTAATGLDVARRQVALADGSLVDFDGLVIATGSAARPLPLPCDDHRRLHQLRTLADARRLAEAMAPGRHLVVVGAGFIGLEVASTARQLGLDVTVVEAAAAPLSRVFGEAVGDWFRRLHERHGVTLRCGSAPVAVETSPGGVRVRFGDGTSVSADLLLAGVGAAPATGWLRDSGLDVTDGVRCRPDLGTAVPGVVAAGDVARWHNPLFGEEMRVEHWSNAVEQGRHAAATLLGAREPFRAVPYFWTDQFDAKVRVVGKVDPGAEIAWERQDDTSMVAVFGRDGVVRGAVCVNAPKQLAAYRRAIADRVAWRDVVRDLAPVAASSGAAGHRGNVIAFGRRDGGRGGQTAGVRGPATEDQGGDRHE
ncbi:MAG: FAD-dependent oxidoreductase [Micromonosporaceae bacterium]